MKIAIFKTIILLSLSNLSFGSSSLDCTSNQNVEYFSHNTVGGVHPFPGMITNIEEIKKNGEVIYRQIRREPCYHGFCNPQQPELTDIIPENFQFNFDEESKKILNMEGTHNSPIYKETFAIKFQLEKSFWMLCDYERALLP